MANAKTQKGIIKTLLDSGSGLRAQNDNSLGNDIREISKINSTVSFEDDRFNSFEYARDMQNNAEVALTTALTNLGLESSDSAITPAQKKAVESVVKYVGSKNALISTLNGLGQASNSFERFDGNNFVQSYSLESLELNHFTSASEFNNGIGKSMANLVVSNESFDGQRLENSIKFSMAVNFMCARQDPLSELFFPTITVDTLTSGYQMDIESYDFASDFTREITGELDDDKFLRKSLIKHQFDNDILLKDYNLVYPIYRHDQNAAHFLNGHNTKATVGDETIDTAPLLVGMEHNLLGMSQTDKTLASGLYTQTDSLDRRMELTNLYIKIEGQDRESQPATEYFRLTTEGLPGAIFAPVSAGQSKELQLNLSTKSLGLNTSKSVTSDGKDSKILDALANDHSVEFSILIGGRANTQTGTTVVSGGIIKISKIRNSEGVELGDKDVTYQAISAALAKISIVAYDLKAGRTNSNFRTRGQRIEINRYSERYPIGIRSDIFVELPVNAQAGDETDLSLVTGQVTALGAYCSAHALDTMLKMADKLKEMTETKTIMNTVGFEGLTLGRYYVDGYYYEEAFDVAESMDSRESGKRFNDVRSFLIDKIYNLVVDAAVDSKYKAAFDHVYGKTSSKKITVGIATDPAIKKFLLAGVDGDTIQLGGEYEGIIRDTLNPRLKGKVVISFVVIDEETNVKPNPLNFGHMLWSPAIVVDLTKNEGNAYTRTVRTIPRYLHQVNVPVMVVLNVADTKNAFNKNQLHVKSM